MNQVEAITSPQNPHLKELRRLHARRHRERSGLFVAEGEDLLSEALRHRRPPLRAYYDADRIDLGDLPLAGLPDSVELLAVRGEALARASALGSGSRVIGVWERRLDPLEALVPVDVAVYLHELSDPGNVGAVLRSALSLVDGLVVLSPGSADPFGPKAVRASMGAVFGQPLAVDTFEAVRRELPRSRALALRPRAGRPLREATLSPPLLFCLGSERDGLPPAVEDGCDEVVHVPLRAGAESLNVAMTATLCLYETALHRLSSPDG